MGFWKDLFRDNNDINEKSFIGFIAFTCMVIALVIDLVTGWLGRALVINEFIFDGFMVITLGAFGIASVDKYINRKNEIEQMKLEDDSTPEQPEQPVE